LIFILVVFCVIHIINVPAKKQVLSFSDKTCVGTQKILSDATRRRTISTEVAPPAVAF
jgi:hypothetical protein